MNNLEVTRDGVEVAKDAAGSDCSMVGRGQVRGQFGLGAMKVMAWTAREGRCAWRSPEDEKVVSDPNTVMRSIGFAESK